MIKDLSLGNKKADFGACSQFVLPFDPTIPSSSANAAPKPKAKAPGKDEISLSRNLRFGGELRHSITFLHFINSVVSIGETSPQP